MKRRESSGLGFTVLTALAGLGVLATILVIFHWTPNDAQLGLVQKIFYIHLPSAIFGYLGFIVCFVASMVYLVRPRVSVDAVARAGAECGVYFCGMVLVTGPFWARKSWDEPWTNEPRLVLTLALFVIFLSYVLLRAFGGRSELVRRVGAVLAILGFADIPLVRMAVARWGGNHPQVIEGGGISREMWLTLGLSLWSFGLVFAALFWLRIRIRRVEEAIEEVHLATHDLELRGEA